VKLRKTDEERAAEVQRKELLAVARQEERAKHDEEQVRERAERQALTAARRARARATTVLTSLGVAVYDGQVYKNSFGVTFGRDARSLGTLAGARAEVTGGQAGHRRGGGKRTADAAMATAVLGPVGLLAAASRKGTKGTAFVVFANGSMHDSQIQDAQGLVKAQADAVRFNSLSAAAERAPDTRATARTQVMVCLDCINQGCDKVLGGDVGWTRSASQCVCQAHH
jgi:hypothetical protein